MDNYIKYVYGETGLVLGVLGERNHIGEVEVKGVFIGGKNILGLISDDVLIDIQLYLEDYLQVYHES